MTFTNSSCSLHQPTVALLLTTIIMFLCSNHGTIGIVHGIPIPDSNSTSSSTLSIDNDTATAAFHSMINEFEFGVQLVCFLQARMNLSSEEGYTANQLEKIQRALDASCNLLNEQTNAVFNCSSEESITTLCGEYKHYRTQNRSSNEPSVGCTSAVVLEYNVTNTEISRTAVGSLTDLITDTVNVIQRYHGVVVELFRDLLRCSVNILLCRTIRETKDLYLITETSKNY